jgi:hypothetical protein
VSEGDGPRDEAWREARRQARADVAAALAPRTRICPQCGAEQDATSRRCGRCGAELVARRGRSRAGRSGLIALAVAAGVAAVLVLAFVFQSRERAASERRTAAQQQAVREEAELRRLRREGRPRSTRLPAFAEAGLADRRRRAVATAERLITTDARDRVRAGRLDGPVIGTRCLPEPDTETRRALEDDPAASRLAYSCVALKSRFRVPDDDGTRRIGLFGHPYRAVIDEARRSINWCRTFPPAGEGARSMSVALDPACRARAPGAGPRR